jgi:cystathionine gamma-synthase
MSALVPLPLGRRIPDSLHAVSCSLPTMRDVIGYETKDPETLRHLTSGYPRFVLHPLLGEIERFWTKRFALDGQALWLTSSLRAAEALRSQLQPAPSRIVEDGGIFGVAHPREPKLWQEAKRYLQRSGLFLPSRQAEDYLVAAGLRPNRQAEALFLGDAEGEVRRTLAPYVGGDLQGPLLANSGMNAIHAAFHGLAAQQEARGRRLWVQLGWLYLDTMTILQRYAGEANSRAFYNVFDLAALRQLIAERGHEIAGIVTEAPTNPLIQTPDLEAVLAMARERGAAVIADPTVASLFEVDLLPYCDVLVTSLTKYAGNCGDVLAGMVMVNPASPFAHGLREAIAAELEPVYPRDLQRLAAQIADGPAFARQTSRSTENLVERLRQDPRVTGLHWSREPRSAAAFAKIARHADGAGGLFTIEVAGPLDRFYDRLRLAKGPSFGMRSSLACPFMYLAHYELVSEEAGQDFLRQRGLNPELVRVAVGAEPVDELIAAFDEALG